MSEKISSHGENPQLPRWRRAGRWARNHTSTLVLLGVTAFVGVAQWPMIRGIVDNAIGAPIPADNISWRKDYQAALQEAKTTGKPLLLDFSASWCPPCQMMKREVWPDKEVGDQVSRSFIPVAIDVDDPAGAKLAGQYQVSGIPDVIVVDGSGKILNRAHYLSKGELLGFLSDALHGREAKDARDARGT